jgi:HD superfamily phosphohydrolase YqeK
MSSERLDHTIRVAELVSEWADAMLIHDSERNRWLRATWLHDALRDAPSRSW